MSTGFNRAESRFQGRYKKEVLSTLAQAYRPARLGAIFILVLGFLGRFTILASANVIGYWVDSFCKTGGEVRCPSVPEFFAEYSPSDFIFLLSVLLATGFALLVVSRVGISRISAHAVSRIYDETTLRTSRLPMSFFDTQPSGRIMTRFSSDYSNVFRVFGGPLAEFLTIVFDLVAMFALVAVASPWLLPLWALLLGLNFLVYRGFLARLRIERREAARTRSPSIAHFAESAAGAASIRAFNRQSDFSGRFERLFDRNLKQRLRAAGWFTLFSGSMTLVTAGVLFLTGLLSIWLVGKGHMGVGAVTVAFTYLGLSSSLIQHFFDFLGQFEEALTGLERLSEYLWLPLEAGATLPAAAGFCTGHELEARPPRTGDRSLEMGEVVFKDVSFRYRQDLPLVLKDFNLVVRSGERVGLVGKTGSGKSTLLQVLFHLYPLEAGEVRIGEKSANRDLSLREFRRKVAYITQEPTLFIGRLRDNLDPEGHWPDTKLADVLMRLQFLGSGSSLEDYRAYLETPVEERGKNFSVGERQLLCMARCLLQGAPVVVMDEATSSVDPHSETILTRAVDKYLRGRTLIVVAHRLSTLASCDRILVLQGGRIVKEGPPSEILPGLTKSESGLLAGASALPN